jgi:hypothetical protein
MSSSSQASFPPFSSESPGELLPENYDPGPLDVCSGRGKRNWNHAGNAAFRNIVQGKVTDYMAAPTKNEKTNIVVEIVDQMRKSGYQFLKENPDGRWYDMGDREAREKVGHGLRDQVTAIKARNKQLQKQRRSTHLQSLSDSEEIPTRRSSAHIIANFARRGSWIAGEEQANTSHMMTSVTTTPPPPAVPMPKELEQRKSSWGFLDGIVEYLDAHPENHFQKTIRDKNAKTSEQPIPVTPPPPLLHHHLPPGQPITTSPSSSTPWGRSKSESFTTSTTDIHPHWNHHHNATSASNPSFRISDLMNTSFQSIEDAHMMYGASSVMNNTFVPRYSDIFVRNSGNTLDNSVFVAKIDSSRGGAVQQQEEGVLESAGTGMEDVTRDQNAIWMAQPPPPPHELLHRRQSFTMQSSSTLRRVTNSLRCSDISMASLQYAMMDMEEDHEVESI